MTQPETELLKGVRVLVVEDDEDSREAIAEILGGFGADVTSAETGLDGLAAFERARPDLIVSDLWMPKLDGFEMMRRIRALPAEQGGLTPAIAVSASENVQRAMMAGYHAFVSKPYDADKLAQSIADFVVADERPSQARWTVAASTPSVVTLTFVGHVRPADMEAAVKSVLPHLEEGPREVEIDLRRLTGFSPSVGSVAERTVWSHRHAIRGVRVIGGSMLARLVAAAACRVLGVPCTFEERIDSEVDG